MPMRSYELTRSPLYRLRSKKYLAELLGCRVEVIKSVLSQSNMYHKFLNNSGRMICAPQEDLKKIQKRIHALFSRIVLPGYLMSGRKGMSYIDNVNRHAGNPFCYTCDVRKFFNSVDSERVFQVFKYRFKMADDVAHLLVRLVTCSDGSFPTGTPTSQIVAYLAYSKTFDAIAEYCAKRKIVFTLYVDDITISSQRKISRKMIASIEEKIEKVGLEIHPEKRRYFTRTKSKCINGVVVSPLGERTLRVRKLLEINENIKKAKKSNDRKLLDRACGMVIAAQMVNPSLFQSSLDYLNKKGRSLLLGEIGVGTGTKGDVFCTSHEDWIDLPHDRLRFESFLPVTCV